MQPAYQLKNCAAKDGMLFQGDRAEVSEEQSRTQPRGQGLQPPRGGGHTYDLHPLCMGVEQQLRQHGLQSQPSALIPHHVQLIHHHACQLACM